MRQKNHGKTDLVVSYENFTMKKINYKSAGVDIDAGNQAVDMIKRKVGSTFSKNVLTGIGGFVIYFFHSEIFIAYY